MALLEGDQVVYVAQQPSPHAMRMFTEAGRRANLHDTGVGKAILATLADAEIRGIVGRVGMPTPTVKSHGTPESLLADVAQIRKRGYAIDDEEQEPAYAATPSPCHRPPRRWPCRSARCLGWMRPLASEPSPYCRVWPLRSVPPCTSDRLAPQAPSRHFDSNTPSRAPTRDGAVPHCESMYPLDGTSVG